MPERVSDTRVTGQERAVSETTALLERWVTSAPQRAERVAQAFRDAGLDDSEIAHELRLRVSRPAATGDAVATFDPAVTRAPSPMLRARLAYAGTIRDGTVCWPDLAGMAKAVQRQRRNARLVGGIGLDRRHQRRGRIGRARRQRGALSRALCRAVRDAICHDRRVSALGRRLIPIGGMAGAASQSPRPERSNASATPRTIAIRLARSGA